MAQKRAQMNILLHVYTPIQPSQYCRVCHETAVHVLKSGAHNPTLITINVNAN